MTTQENQSKSCSLTAQRRGLLNRSILIGLWGVLVFCCVRPIWNIDLFWHVVAGDLIQSTGKIPTHDTFSAFHPERLWVPFQWGYEVLVAQVDEVFGLQGLRWMHIILHALAFGLAARIFYRRLGPVSALSFAFLMVAYLDRIRARPHVFNLIGVLLLALWIEHAARRARAEHAPIIPNGLIHRMVRLDLLLIFLGVFWANLHAGGSLLVPVVGGAFLFGLYLEQAPDRFEVARSYLLAILAMVLCPSFIEGVSQAFLMWGETRALIPEWSSPLIYLTEPAHPIHRVMGAIPFLVALLWVVRVGKERFRVRFPEAIASAALLGLSFSTARFLYLAPVALIVWPSLITGFNPRRKNSPTFQKVKQGLLVFFSLLLLTAFAHEHLYEQSRGPTSFMSKMNQTVDATRFPLDAGAFLEETQLSGNAMHQSDWGGFLLYVSRQGVDKFPAIRVAGDGRGNFGPDVIAHFIRSHRSVGRNQYLWQKRGQFPVDLVIFPTPTFELNYHNPWRFLLVYSGPMAEIHLMPGAHLQPNIDRALRYYQSRIESLPDPRKNPVHFEQAVRTYWASQRKMAPDVLDSLADFAARAESAGAAPNKQALVIHLEWSAYLQSVGDLMGASKQLKIIQKALPGTDPLGSAARIRQAALQLMMGLPADQARHLLHEVKSPRLSPVDVRLRHKIGYTLPVESSLDGHSH